MQISRIHLLLLLNVAVIYAGIAWFMPLGYLPQIGLVGIAMALSLVAPYLIISFELKTRDKYLVAKDKELMAANSEVLEARRKAQEAATLDDLTGAFNKRHFQDLLNHHWGIATRGNYVFSICSTQIDDFEKVVEKFGEKRADEILSLFVSVAKSSLREVDFVARLEREKFGLMLSDASEEDAILAVNRMADLIHQIRVSDDDPEFRLATSAGLAEFRKEVTVEKMMAHADEALGFAINEGGHRVAAHIHSTTESS